MQTLPLWATPQRRARLVEIFQRARPVIQSNLFDDMGFCTIDKCYKDTPACRFCQHNYPNYIEVLVSEWVSEDKVEEAVLWRKEQRQIHKCLDEKGWGKRFDPVDRVLFFAGQPPYYAQGIAPSSLTHTRFTKIRVSSSGIRLFVDVPRLSKNKRKKIRRAMGIQPDDGKYIDKSCLLAVKDFWGKVEQTL